jgi:hypothetical protein
MNQDNYSSQYYGEGSSGQLIFDLSIKHTLPKSVGDAHSHLVRLDVTVYDASGVYQRSQSIWFVIKTHDAKQETTQLVNEYLGLAALFDSTLMTSVVGNES